MKKRGFVLNFDAVCYLLAFILFVAAGTYGYSEHLENARHSTAKNQIAGFVSAVSHYHYDMGKYPTALTDLTKAEGNFGPWIADIPKDPWGHNYQYKLNSDKNRFVVYSAGKSGAEVDAETILEPKDTTAVFAYGQ